jgi:alpha-tubulin suppressor-like RCC1 family protein
MTGDGNMRTAKLPTGSLIFLAGILLVMTLTPARAADLSLYISAKSLEGYGVLSNAGKVSVPSALASDLIIELTSDDPSEVLVPETVTILAGETSARFDLTIVDDDEVDGPQSTIITATASGWNSGITSMTVMDNDPRHVSPAIAGGGAHTVALKNDWIPWAWGSNADGQLGDGTTTSRNFPVKVSSGVEVIHISAGRSAGEDGSFTVAVCADGTVMSWGNNHYGQLGDGTTTNRYTALQVLNLDNVMETSAGTAHSLALKADGTVWAWGRNDRGQLGDGTTTNRTFPVQIFNFNDVVAVDAGESHSLALKGDGTLWAWGYNGSGQLGDGTTTNRTVPVQVSDLTSVIAIGAGSYHSLAAKSDGSAWAWGLNYYGQLGDETTTNRKTPVRVFDLSDVTAICAGMHYSLALKGDGTVRAWGVNWFGSLGDGTTTHSPFPVQVSDLTDVIAIDAGMYHALAIKEDGTVWAWGLNEYSQLGDGTNTNRTTPVQVVGSGGVGFLSLITENLPPFAPSNPTPVNDEAGVSVPGGSTTLIWSGGDPDQGDTVTYDVLHGASSDSLVVVATGIDGSSCQVSGLAEGATY